ncbi:MAG: helicase-related protein, partial [Pyrinomonadaceae bacterium]
GTVFRLEDSDIKHDRTVEQRLGAKKCVRIISVNDGELEDALAEQAWTLADKGKSPIRCLVFCDKRETAENTKAAIQSLAKGDKKLGRPEVQIDTELFVGARRVFEREGVAAKLKELGFIAGSAVSPTKPAFLIATSAGEVGVDLDADHMVCDLVAWERMVQRLGRVNRRGEGDAKVVVALEPEPKPKKAVSDALSKSEAGRNEKDRKAIAAFEAVREKSLAESLAFRRPFDEVPLCCKDGTIDASPGALRDLKMRATSDEALRKRIEAATTPAPVRPALTRALVDSWSMTSLEEHTGRPEVRPWLRGWIDDDKPQTAVVWRKHLPVRTGDTRPSKKEIEGFFEAAPPHASELLETETWRVVDWLIQRATMLLSKHFEPVDVEEAADGETEQPAEASDSTRERMAILERRDALAFVLSGAGDLRKTLHCGDIIDADNKKAKEKKKALEELLIGSTLVVDVRLGGLRDGLLNDDVADTPPTADDGDEWPNIRFRVRSRSAGDTPTTDRDWRERLRFDLERTEDGESKRWLVVEKWRHDAATEEDRSAGRPQALDEHQSWTARKALNLAQRLGLEGTHVKMLVCAARLHDEGKRAERWQRAFNAPRDGKPYAKTTGPLNQALLGGYRHEFGSLPFGADDPEFKALPADMQELVLHLIAAHHGYARPVISTDNCEDAPPSALKDRAREVALRFARLQKRWGPWGLAWWEAMLRAADQQASRDNDAREDESSGEGV